jgi:hypothetical protein
MGGYGVEPFNSETCLYLSLPIGEWHQEAKVATQMVVTGIRWEGTV